MSIVFCPLCDRRQDSDFVGCHELETAVRRELICGDCCEQLPERLPEDEHASATIDGKPVDWTEWS